MLCRRCNNWRAFRAVRPALEANRPFAKPRHEVIATTPAPHEREMAKMAALADALAAALKARRVADLRAELAAHELNALLTNVGT